MYYLYIITCNNGAYYTGYTTDIKRRYQEHCAGSPKCKYTRSFPPLELSACWELLCGLSDVLKIEKMIKTLPKSAKQLIVNDITPLPTLLEEKAFTKNIIHSINRIV